ncbi:MAG TPA: glycosyltransferase family 1 protein [Bacteroidia bacterium]|nr:glycosyltransferase family 1 protein [Bacteroidia bacterium]
MLIAINCRLLVPEKMDGIGWFTYHVVKQLTFQHPEMRFLLLFDREYPKEVLLNSNVEAKILKPQARHPFLYYLWFEFAVADALKMYNPDVFLSPDGYLSLRTHIPQVAVIHDINFEHYPKDLPWLTRKYYRYFFPRFAQKAARIATVSKFSKQDIADTYHIAPEKIDVVYNGVSERYKVLDDEERRQIRNEISEGNPYFVFVGSLHPRKNIANMLLAFDAFKDSDDTGMQLVIAGHRMWWSNDMEQAWQNMRHKTAVRFLGRTPLEQLTKIVGGAYAMVYVSNFEGFGVPLIEAMRCGVPVITSNTTSMPEVAGEAALFADPANVSDITSKMQLLASDSLLYSRISAAGLERSAQFTWSETAERLWMCVIRAVSGL